MATIRTLAQQYNMEPFAVAAALDLGNDYNETAEITADDETWMREALDILAKDAADLA